MFILLLLVVACQKQVPVEPVQESVEADAVSSDLSEVDSLDDELDTTELDELDSELTDFDW